MTEVLRSSQYPKGMLMAAGVKKSQIMVEPVLFIIELSEGVQGR